MPGTGIEGGDEVLAALQELDGEPTTAEIAERAGIPHTATLVALGKLGQRGTVVLIKSDRPSRSNPKWRLPQVGEEGYAA